MLRSKKQSMTYLFGGKIATSKENLSLLDAENHKIMCALEIQKFKTAKKEVAKD